jgi:hypothetical protein
LTTRRATPDQKQSREGFHTNIVKEVSKYGEEGDAALAAELKNIVHRGILSGRMRRTTSRMGIERRMPRAKWSQ